MKKSGIPDVSGIKELLSETVEKYKEVIGEKLVEIILFGSYARDHQVKYSDLDLMVLINDTDENIKKFDKRLEDFNHALTMKYEILVTCVMISSALFEEYRDSLPFYMNVEKEGVMVYERTAA